MRIIAGRAGGIHLKVPALVARPTADRVREALFSMLGEAVDGARVLDLFSGSGALGLECLSRGAAEAVFVEQHAPAAALIQENLARTRLPGGKVIRADAYATLRRFAEGGTTFDLIFADPPYTKKPGDPDYIARLLDSEHLGPVLAPSGLLVLETMVTKGGSGVIANWQVVRDRSYGSTRILVLQLPTHPDGATLGAVPLQSDVPSGAAGDAAGCHQEDESPGRAVE
jgi:16S rRNA (guanine966-N2)-methyltransferase